MKLRPTRPLKRARIEIIPLIDVIFFLLATFVLVSLSMTRLQGLNINLPTGQSGADSKKIPDQVTVYVTDEGGYIWQDEALTFEQLLTRMAKYRRDSPDPMILINGDENANWIQAVNILDEARRLNIDKVSIETQLKKRNNEL